MATGQSGHPPDEAPRKDAEVVAVPVVQLHLLPPLGPAQLLLLFIRHEEHLQSSIELSTNLREVLQRPEKVLLVSKL